MDNNNDTLKFFGATRRDDENTETHNESENTAAPKTKNTDEPKTAPTGEYRTLAERWATDPPFDEVMEEVKPPKKPLPYKPIALTLLAITTLCSITALGLSIYNYYHSDGGTSITLPAGADGNAVAFKEGSIAEVASKVSPAVVSITTETRTYGYFGQEQTAEAAGTGMIVSNDGYVLTNKHVIDGASKIQVILDSGDSYTDVSVVGTDPTNDVAYLKIANASNLPTVTLGDSKTITVGQQVITIGNALGMFQNTVADGIISGLGRTLVATDQTYSSSETLTDMIQTTAAINAGNSGGPLVNAAGQVIGINTATSESGSDLGFAIPISSVKGMLNNIIKNNKAERAFLGTAYINITPDVVKQYNLPTNSGAYVHADRGSAVVTGSPADKAGIKDGDIIKKINGYEVGKAGTVSTLIGEYMPGDTVQITILRDGAEQNLTATLAAYPTK